MKVTFDIQDYIYNNLEILARKDGISVEEEIEKGLILLIDRRILIQRLTDEICDEFDVAMKRLA